MSKRLNVVYIIADQLRYDCIGINGNDNIDTPNLDMMANFGHNFKNTYVAVPSCIPARASIMTGMKPKNHKRVGYEDEVTWDYENMLPEMLSKNGYHTQAVGKLHVYPNRNLIGFNNVVLHDGYLHCSRKKSGKAKEQFEATDDYLVWLRNELGRNIDLYELGLGCNSWDARPWNLPEYMHPTNWVVDQSIDFLRRKDPTKPFFLNMSFVSPHSPLNPPQVYFDEYKDREVELPFIGSWEKENSKLYDIDGKSGVLDEKYIIKARRAYQALVSHIDQQLKKFMIAIEEYDELDNTIFIFSSDHGDLLGDHNFLRKSLPYEGSSHIPLFIYDPGHNITDESSDIYEVVELMDIMPTILDICGIEIPNTVDGKSLLPLMRKEQVDWRKYIHGEHAYGEYSNHFVTNGKVKYIWYSQSGEEQFFNLEIDPEEKSNEINNGNYSEKIDEMRNFLIKELTNREEGYTDGKKLIKGMPPVDTLRA